MIFTDEIDEMGWYDELVMVYVIGFINSRLLGFCCFVALFLFVLLCYAYVVIVYGIVVFIVYCIAYVVWVFLFCWFVAMIYVIVFCKVLLPCLWY